MALAVHGLGVKNNASVGFAQRDGLPLRLRLQFLAEGHDPKFIGAPMPIQTYMHRDWEPFTREGL